MSFQRSQRKRIRKLNSEVNLKKNKLVLDNYVYYGDLVIKLTSLSESKVQGIKGNIDFLLPYESIKGIPLSTRWLVNLGFKEIGINKYTYIYKGFFIHRRKRGWITRCSDMEIQYVHELQNAVLFSKNESLILTDSNNDLII